jgi:hypothetical protein
MIIHSNHGLTGIRCKCTLFCQAFYLPQNWLGPGKEKSMIIKNRYGKKVCEIDELDYSVTIKKKDSIVTIRFRQDGPAQIIEAIV